MYSAFNTLTQENNIQAPWESIAWKHTITQDIQATVGVQHGNTHSHKRIYKPCGGSSINTLGYTSSVGVQHGNTQSYRIYKRPWESSMETHIHTRGYTGYT